MKPSEVAYKAARVMSERGHCKMELTNPAGAVCFNGALNYVLTGDPEKWATPVYPDYVSLGETVTEAFDAIQATAQAILRARGRQASWDLADWWDEPVMYNNHPSTSGEDVILLLKETGHALEAEGQ